LFDDDDEVEVGIKGRGLNAFFAAGMVDPESCTVAVSSPEEKELFRAW
jgi:hypothetical protein